MATPEKPSPLSSDVLHSEGHSKLTPEEIAKAVARHKREHPSKTKGKVVKPPKTSPRG